MTDQLELLDATSRRAGSAPTAEVFRPIHYLGSKARVLPALRAAIDDVAPSFGRAVDLFSGSGVVAAALAQTRAVIGVDVQEYARVLASAVLHPARLAGHVHQRLAAMATDASKSLASSCLGEVLRHERDAARALERGDPQPLCEILESGSLIAAELGERPSDAELTGAIDAANAALQKSEVVATMTRYYGGVYFSYAQAAQLDSLLKVVRTLPVPHRDTALAAVLGAASECVTSVGNHFAQPVRPRDKAGRPKLALLTRVLQRRRRDIFVAFAERLERYGALPGAIYPAEAVRGDYGAFLDAFVGDLEVVYADPPYTRDHYSRFYHVLETIACGDIPEISTLKIAGKTSLTRALYRRDRHQSPFCIRSEASDAFRRLFQGVRHLDVPLVLSYSPYEVGTVARPETRLLTIPALVGLASESFATVELRSAGEVVHSKFNTARLNGSVNREAEVLLICTP